MTTSRISGFYNMTLEDRRAKLTDAADQTPENLLPFTTGGLSAEAADHMIENVIGLYSLPLGIALNFQVNGRDVLVPMTLEEPSVVAGASFMAKLARAGGGYTATTTDDLAFAWSDVVPTSGTWRNYELADGADESTAMDETGEIDPEDDLFHGRVQARHVTAASEDGYALDLPLHRCCSQTFMDWLPWSSAN